MPNRSRQNARRWRRLDWQEIREGIQDPPTIDEPFEPSPEPAPEPIEVQAQLVPTEALVITAEEMPEPETRIQLVSNPEQKKKIQQLGKENQRLRKLHLDTHAELEKQGELNTLQHEAIKKLKKAMEDKQKEIMETIDSSVNVNNFDMMIIKQMAKWKCGMGEVTLCFYWATSRFGDLPKGVQYVDKSIANHRDNAWEHRTDEEKEKGFFQMRLGSWVNLKDCYKYFIMDKNNYWWVDFISVPLKERLSKLRIGLVEMDAWGKWACGIADVSHKKDAVWPDGIDPESLFSIMCDEALTENAETDGVKCEAMDGNALNYYKKKIDLKRTVGQRSELDPNSNQEDLMKWEKAKNSIINL